MTPENNVSGAEISTSGTFIVKTGSTPTLGLTLDASQNATFAGDVGLADNKKLTFGAAPDFEIYHNSTTNVNHISSLLSRQLSISADNTTFTGTVTISKTASGSTTQVLNLVNPVGTASTGVRLWMSGTNTTTRGTFIDAVAETTSNDHSLRFGTSAASSAPTERMRISSAGAIKFNAYDSTNNTGTPTYLLGTDASGNVVKTNSAPSPITSQAASLYDLIPNGAFTTTYAFTSTTAGAYYEVMEGNDVITASGTYSVQMFVNDYAVGGTQYSETYSGIMSWTSATNTNNGNSVSAISEIVLHRSGHAANTGITYLRTRETTSVNGGKLKLEIMCNRTYTGASNVVFKFVRLI